MKKLLVVLAAVVAIVGIVNLLSFFALSLIRGGDAFGGYMRDGRYYVTNHGEETEVSEAEWRRSRLQGQSLLLTIPLTMVSTGYLMLGVIFPRFMYRGSRQALDATERAVRDSGPPLATTYCGGRIGPVQYRGPLLRATVFPGGVVLKPFLQPPCALAAAEITGVRDSPVRWPIGQIAIVHTSAQVARPIYLGCGASSPFVAALRGVISSAALSGRLPAATP